MTSTDRSPDYFCWTRFGTEAGQTIDAILARKEAERRRNQGLFLWGVGNALGPGVRELVRRCVAPEVLFSPIRSAPRLVDVAPESVVAWSHGQTLDGNLIPLPEGSVVISRAKASRPHYALVCAASEPLVLEKGATTDATLVRLCDLRNLLSGKPVGTSQVTAVVCRTVSEFATEPTYPIAFRARLVYPYFLRLVDPVRISSQVQTACTPRLAWQACPVGRIEQVHVDGSGAGPQG
jgi:hypothetical protein